MLVQEQNLMKMEDCIAALVTTQFSDEGLPYHGT
jgi:hypothetical protein